MTAIENVLDRCLGFRAGEDVVLLVDDEVVDRIWEGLVSRSATPIVARIRSPELPGAEPPPRSPR